MRWLLLAVVQAKAILSSQRSARSSKFGLPLFMVRSLRSLAMV
jgi:hypothetical protein